jgi:hypothetical protein
MGITLLPMARGVVVAALLAWAAVVGVRAQACALPGELRRDCGYLGIGQGECEGRGCCWSPLTEPGNNWPWCFYKDLDVCAGYTVTAHRDTAAGFELSLNLTASYGPPLSTHAHTTHTYVAFTARPPRLLWRDVA